MQGIDQRKNEKLPPIKTIWQCDKIKKDAKTDKDKGVKVGSAGGAGSSLRVSEGEEDEAFDLELLIEIIADTPQVEGVDIICRENNPASV